MPENVKTPDPTRHGNADEDQNDHRPPEQTSIVLCGAPGWRGIGVLEPTTSIFISELG
jgi:hypothetical protein